MSISKRATKQGFAYDVRYRTNGKNKSRSFATLDEAEAFEHEQKRRRRQGSFAVQDPSDMPLSNFLEHWFTNGRWAKTTTINRAQLCDRWIEPFIGDVPLRELGRQQVREFRADIMRAGSPPTNANNVMRCLSAALGVAVHDGLIPYNPCQGLGAVPQPKAQRRAYPREVTDALLAAMPTPRDRAIFLLLRDAGLRPAELVGLQWRDIDGDTLTIYDTIQSGETVGTKTGVFRSIPIEPELAGALAVLPHYHDDDYVVPGDRGGPLNWKMWTRRVWGPAKAAAKTPAVPYEMRHTFASTLIIERGLDVATVAALMGHASPRITLDHYVHLFQKARGPVGRSGRQARAQ